MPAVVTHRYDPIRGACLNLCSLPDSEASLVLDRLRRESRPALKPNYLARRRATEVWLFEDASRVLGRALLQHPAYFFLGDFSYCHDASRPAALVFPLENLPADSITFTLGDSMSIGQDPRCRLYTLAEMVGLFADGADFSGFGFTDEPGYQARFVEVQVWDTSAIAPFTSQARVLSPEESN